MSVDIGIIGLPKSGKTSIFNGLTRGRVATTGPVPAHVSTVSVPDARLKALTEIFHPTKVVPAEVRYTDIGAAVSIKDEAISGQLLAQVSTADVLIQVVRAFQDESVPHIKGSVDAGRDIGIMDLELAFSDMAIIEKRQGRIEQSLKAARPQERPQILKEQELLARIRTGLEKNIPVREMDFSADEARTISNYQFLTAKPVLLVINIGEDQLSETAAIETRFGTKYGRPKCRVIALCGKLESELAQLDAQAAEEFRREFGIEQSGLDRIIHLSYDLLGLISFFTTVSNEIRAWSITRGTEAVHAAGKIHTDMERGFIRAEVVSYDDLIKCGSIAEAKRHGLLRLEGKNYTVQDGDVVTILFNV